MTPAPFENTTGSDNAARHDMAESARHRRLEDILAFILSALASPFLVLPIFAIAVAARCSANRAQFLLWALLGAFFSTGIPFLYILIGVKTGRITDMHVREREQRNGPFIVALFSSAAGAALLYLAGAPLPLIVLGIGIIANGVVFLLITLRWKISMHPSVYTATVVAGTFLLDHRVAWLLCMLPAIVWARSHRSRHNIAQGLAAIGIAALITLAVLAVFGYLH